MNRNRFEDVKSSKSNLELDSIKNKDKLFKVKHLVENLQNNFRKIPMDQNLFVDKLQAL